MPPFEVLGLHFGIWKTEAKDTFYYWLEILRDVFPPSVLEQVGKYDNMIAIIPWTIRTKGRKQRFFHQGYFY